MFQSISSELLRLWHHLMQPNHEKRPTVKELLDRNIFKVIRSVHKSEIRRALAKGKVYVTTMFLIVA